MTRSRFARSGGRVASYQESKRTRESGVGSRRGLTLGRLPTPSPGSFMQRRVVAVSLVMALQLLGDSLLYVVLPLHADELGFSGFQVGVLLSANRFVRMLTNRGASRLMRRLDVGPLFTAA